MTHPVRGPNRIRRIVGVLREPVLAESRRQLGEKWERLSPHLRTARQMYGRQGGGCGATIGAMPRCDFACRGCYLGKHANQVSPLPLVDLYRQIDRLREELGDGGNLQLTDGEITLRPVGDLVALIRYARRRGLIPMLMTHGDTFRRRPGLLEQLMRDGGLSEISVHVDTTQRGRTGAMFRHAIREEELTPLRDEFATLVRRARRVTGYPLSCAMTMTVTRGNLDGVPAVAAWAMRNADAVHLLSFQPVALVGRTDPAIAAGVSVEQLWAAIAAGVFAGGDADTERRRAEFIAAHVHFGHPACNRVVPGLAVRTSDGHARFVAIRRDTAEDDMRIIDDFLARFGGISMRRDAPLERVMRVLGIIARAPAFFARGVVGYGRTLLRRMAPDGDVARLVAELIRGNARVDRLLLVSHHFMNGVEMATPLGQERLANCVFHVPRDGELVPMCAMNAAGGRDAVYASIERRSASS